MVLVVLVGTVETGIEELVTSSVSSVLYSGLLGMSMRRRAGRLGKCETGDENRSHSGKKKITTSVQQVQKN